MISKRFLEQRKYLNGELKYFELTTKTLPKTVQCIIAKAIYRVQLLALNVYKKSLINQWAEFQFKKEKSNWADSKKTRTEIVKIRAGIMK